MFLDIESVAMNLWQRGYAFRPVNGWFESYVQWEQFCGDESRVCCGCGAGSPFRPSLFIPHKNDAGRGYACYDCCMPIPCLCLHTASYFLCHHHWFCLHILHLVPVLFNIVIPTSLNILMKCFRTCFTCFSLPNTCSSISSLAPPLLLLAVT